MAFFIHECSAYWLRLVFKKIWYLTSVQIPTCHTTALKRALRFLYGLTLLFLLAQCTREKTFHVETEVVKVESLDQIVPLEDSLVKPILYTHIKGLKHLPVRKAKRKFVAAVLPSILVAKQEVNEYKRRLSLLHKKRRWTEEDSTFYRDIITRYKTTNVEALLDAIGTLPNSVVLAQAAVESGWGQSRFFLQGNNLFGVWSFNHYEPRIAAARTRNKKRIYLRAYHDMAESIEHYFQILSSAKPYKSLRKARQQTDDPFALLPHLKNFSERREAYIRQLRKVIVVNNFTQYDAYEIDPAFIVEEDVN